MRKKIIILCHCIVFCCCINVFAFEDPEQIIYLTEDFPPYSYIEDEELKGFSVELLKMIWIELGVKPQPIKMYPWARAYKKLQSIDNVVLFTTAKTAERVNQFKWVGPVSSNSRTVLLSLKSNHIRIKSIDQAKKYIIGTTRDDAAEQILLSKGIKKQKIVSVSNLTQNIRKLHLGRIDLIAYNEYSFFNSLDAKNDNHDEYETVFLVHETEPCFAFNLNISDQLVQKFQIALDKIKNRNEYQHLLEKYMH